MEIQEPKRQALLPSTAVVANGALIITMTSSAVNPALPTLARVFGVDASAVAWVSLINTLVTVSTLATFGRLSDMTGKKSLYAVGIVVTVAGSVLCGLSASLGTLVATRALQAIGTTILSALSVAYLVAIYPTSRRGSVVGLWEVCISLGLGVGPVIGGLLLGSSGWQSVFYVAVPLGLVSLAAIPRFMIAPPRPASHQQFDLAGAALLTASIGALMYALTRGYQDGWGSPLILGCLAVSVLAAAAFLVVERRIEQPVVDLSMFRSVTFSAGNAAKVAGYAPLSATQLLTPFYLDQVLHLSPETLGLVLAAFPAGMLTGSALFGPLSDRIGTRILAPAGLLVSAGGLLLLVLIRAEQGTTPALFATFLVGLGVGGFIAPNDSSIMSAAPAEKMGVANGIMGVSRAFGLAIGGALGAGLLTAREAAHGGDFVAGFHDVFVVMAAVSLGGVWLAALRDPAAAQPPVARTRPTSTRRTCG